MKRLVSMIALLFTLTFTASAMSYEQAREQALFLTDKMAYELNLTDDQYEAAYEINLDYLMSVNSVDDLYGSYWRYRNLDMSYVLLDWQYRAFCDAAYFYRPLYFSGGYWRFGVYARYPHRDYFYFSRPRVYVTYVGGHSWHSNHGRSWYDGRHFGPRSGDTYFGMRDGFNRGDYGRGNRQTFGSRQPSQQHGTTSFGSRVSQPTQQTNRQPGSFGSRNNQLQQSRPNSSFGGRESSTRTTVRQSSDNAGQFGSRRSGTTVNSNPRPTFGSPVQRQNSSQPSTGSSRGSSSSSFGSSRGSSSNSFGSSRGSFGSRSGSSSGGSRVSAPSRPSSSQSNGGGSSHNGFGSRR